MATLRPASKEAYQLLHNTAIAFARMEEAGLRVDVPRLKDSIQQTRKQLDEMQKRLTADPVYKTWEKVYGNKMNLESPAQLGKVVFDIMGYKRNKFMGDKNTVAALEHLTELPFKNDYFDFRRMKKALSTNLLGMQREIVGDRLRCFFDAHTTESYRGSSSMINLQNQPIRNKSISEIVRSCIIPSKDHVFLEADYGTQEVRGSYCYHRDPKLKYDILHGDMHTDRSLDLFMLTREELGPVDKGPGKMIRYVAKNKFVFAQFYGSYYAQCAPDLWDAISMFDLRTAQGKSLFEHLESKGITSLGLCSHKESPKPGTYEALVQKVEKQMWEKTYTVYAKWKHDWWRYYCENGGVNTLTGFRMEGVFRRNQILCDPIQGSSHHCLAWSIYEIQQRFIRYRLRSKVVVQIHDSVLIDTYKDEIETVRKIIYEVMLESVVQYYKWICIPLSVELDIAEKNWFEKVPFKG